MPAVVHADLLAVQSSLQSLVVAFKKFTSGSSGSQSSIPSVPQSKRRHRRRQATLRKLYAAAHIDRLVASLDKETQTPSCQDASVPSGSLEEESMCLGDLDIVKLRTYDLSLSALRAPLRSSGF